MGRRGERAGVRGRRGPGESDAHGSTRPGLHASAAGDRGICAGDDGAVLGDLPAGGVSHGLDRLVLRDAQRLGGGSAGRGDPGGSDQQRGDLGRRGDGDLPATDRAAVLPDRAAGGHGISCAGGVRGGSSAAAVRAERSFVRPAAFEPRMCAARDHVGAGDSGPARPTRDDSGGAVHDLHGADPGVCAAGVDSVSGQARNAGAGVQRGVCGRGRGGADQCAGGATDDRARAQPGDGAGVAGLSRAEPADGADDGAGAGVDLPEEGGDGDPRDLDRSVVAEQLPGGRAVARG